MTMKASIMFGLLLVFIISAILVVAKPDMVPATNDKAGVSVIIPAHAVQVADNVFSLGQAQDLDGRVVEGFMFIDKKKAPAKPGTVCGNNICEPGETKSCPGDCAGGGGTGSSTCFAVIANGAKWKATEPYITGFGIAPAVTETSLNTWDSEVAFDVFGAGDVNGTTDGADDVSPDGKNEVEFVNLGEGNTIAVTTVWGIFRGPPGGRELVEWDAEFNTAYSFGDADTSPGIVMDYQNIATHEFGHALGLAHPDDSCTEETMYRFADFNETKKRTLESGDVAGVNNLYS